jgi:hypothetical protein
MPRRAKKPFTDHAKTAAWMRANPLTWVQVGIYNSKQSATAVMRRIRTGEGFPSYLPAGAYEAARRMVEEGIAVDARYIGTGPQPTEEDTT